MDIKLVFLLLAFAFGFSQACSDRYPRKDCRALKKYCHERLIKIYCRKTCRACKRPKTTGRPVQTTRAPRTTDLPPVTRATPVVPSTGCGIPAVAQSRVIAGHDAKPGAWPWQIALKLYGRFICGGSLITPEWVLTAAHCVERIKQPRGYEVVLGVQDLNKKESSWQTLKVIRRVSHPVYGSLNNDVALLKLEKPARLNNRVRTVCLPSANSPVKVGTKCFITGWGKTKHPGNAHPILQQADLPVVAKDTCNALNSKSIPVSITDEMLCAGHGPTSKKSGCHGDSGGPFVCQTGPNGAYELHGAVSWGSRECKASDAYTVFARITKFRTWIDRVIKF